MLLQDLSEFIQPNGSDSEVDEEADINNNSFDQVNIIYMLLLGKWGKCKSSVQSLKNCLSAQNIDDRVRLKKW